MSVSLRYPASDGEAIEFVRNSGCIDTVILNSFENTYNKYFVELVNKDIDESSLKKDCFDDIVKNLKGVIDNVDFKNHICQPFEYFKNKAQLITHQDFDRIKETINKKNVQDIKIEDKKLIVKMWRSYNMFLKYGHSAKATWVANYILTRTFEDAKKNISSQDAEKLEKINAVEELLRKIVLTSTFQHDLGRFYQAVNYDTLLDGVMAKKEKEIVKTYLGDDIDFRHAEAGYYYAATMNYKLNQYGYKKGTRDFITDTLTAVTIKEHSLVNSKLIDYEFPKAITDINIDDLDGTLNDLSKFLIDCYQSIETDPKEKVKYSLLLPATYKSFVDEVITNTIASINSYEVMDVGIKIDPRISLQRNKIANEISSIMNDADVKKDLIECRGRSYNKIFEQLANRIACSIKKIISIKDSSLEKRLQENILLVLKESMDYDIAKVVKEKIKNNDLPDLAKYIISMSINTVLDSDKIDILDQRAKGLYNAPYKLESISIYPPKGKTFIEILMEYFHFSEDDIKKDFDSDLIKEFIDQTNIKKVIFYNMTEEQKKQINIEEDKIIRINFITGNIRFKNSEKTVDINVGDLFNRDWHQLAKSSCVDKKDDKESTISNMSLKINRDLFVKNIEKKYTTEEEKVEAFRINILGRNNILDADDNNTLPGRFKLESDNPVRDGWIVKIDDEHLISNPITSCIWHFNQYILVNIRSVYSLELIKNEGILDNILKMYEIKTGDSYNYEGKILEEYAYYAKGFIDYVLKYCYENNITFLSPDLLIKFRCDYNSKVCTNTDITFGYGFC